MYLYLRDRVTILRKENNKITMEVGTRNVPPSNGIVVSKVMNIGSGLSLPEARGTHLTYLSIFL